MAGILLKHNMGAHLSK